jgi:hypothetical protein
MKAKYALENPGLHIEHLIYHCDDSEDGEILVYVDKKLDLDWECDDKAQKGADPAVGSIWNGVSRLEPITDKWPRDLKRNAKRLLGEAVARVLRKDVVAADVALVNAREFIMAKSRQVSRYWTLQACLVSGAVACVAGLTGARFEAPIVSAISRTPYLLCLCFSAGCAGALLSVILRLGKQPRVDSTAERHLHYIEGVSRIAAGGIAGILVGAMVKLQLFFPVFANAGVQTLAMCTAAMIAGASERLAAGIVTKVENQETIEGNGGKR